MTACTLVQAQIACLMRTEHDDINVNVVDVQSQVIANNNIMYVTGSSLIKTLIHVKNINLDYTSIFRHCSTSVQTFTPTFYT